MMTGRMTALLTLLALLALPGAFLAGEPEQATVEGWVEVWEETDTGEVLSVYIDVDGTWYIVENAGEGAKLVEFVGDEVRATGTVQADPEDSSMMRITVKSFTVLEEEPTPEEPFDEPEPAGRF